MTLQELEGLCLALALGWLIGAERGWQARDEEPGGRVAGIRTFALLALVGGFAGMKNVAGQPWLGLILVGAALIGLLLGYFVDMQRDHNVSATTTVAGVLTIGWGAAAGGGLFTLASVGTGATLLLLTSRKVMHSLLEHVSEEDLKATIRLVLVVLIVFPLLPDANLGPLGALNPRRIWMVVVTTGAISFGGYVLARWLGNQRSVLVVATVGAMVSSTAVTLDAARRVRAGEGGLIVQAAVPLASAVMLARSLVLVALLAPAAFGAVAVAVGPALALSVAAAAALLLICRAERADSGGREPLAPGLGLALWFAASVAVLTLATAWVEGTWGEQNAVLLIASGGTFDIDAAIAAVGALPAGTLSAQAAALALTAPTLLNTLFKLVLFVVGSGWPKCLPGALSLAVVALALLLAVGLSMGF